MSEFQRTKRIFRTAALAVLGAFAGIGVAWAVVATLANRMSKENGSAFIAGCIPKLVAGGILGFGLGMGFAVFLFKARAEAVQEAVEKKYGVARIYFGVPIFFLTLFASLIAPWWHRLELKYGVAAVPCLLFGMGTVFLVLSMVVRSRIPRGLIVPLGLLGWMLTLIIACSVGWIMNHRQ